MSQKTISLPEELYNKLKKEKREDESFAQLILRLLKKNTIDSPIGPLVGIFRNESNEWDEIEKNSTVNGLERK